jgi:anti-anti-sigma factor
MAIHTTQDGDTTVVTVSGRLDAVTAAEYRTTTRELFEGGAKRVVVDFQALDYVSSAGLGELLAGAQFLTEKGGRLCLANVHGTVLSVFEMCGVDKMLTIHSSVADAIASLA